MKRTLVLLAGLAAAVPLAGYAKWRRDSAAVTRSVEARADVLLDNYARARVSTMPDPVVRYFRRALPENQHFIRFTRLEQEGEFLLNGAWKPFRATQLFSSRPAGFVWDARISAAPLMPVFVRDSYVAGTAGLRASMLGLYTVANQHGAPRLNEGALMRWLAEAAWFPTALLPDRSLSWSPLDEHAALATYTDGHASTSLRFTFTEDGDIAEIYSAARYRESNGDYIPTPWRVRAVEHDLRHGIRIMTRAEVEWLLPEGVQTYWRGRIVGVDYE